MLKQRIITAVILAILLLGALFFAPAQQFDALIALVVFIAAWEWANMSGFSQQGQRILYALVTMACVAGTACYSGYASDAGLSREALKTVFGLACGWWAVALLWVQSYPGSGVLWGRRWSTALMGLLVLVPTWVAFMFLRSEPQGAWLILLLVAIVAAADIGAYFVGRAIGKRKLALAVSPGKSWEGFWGGFATCMLLALGLSYWLDTGMVLLAIVAPVALSSVLGDLLASMVKRQRGIKDSSNLLPGHGGFMDRVDSLTAAAPVFALAIVLSGWQLPAF